MANYSGARAVIRGSGHFPVLNCPRTQTRKHAEEHGSMEHSRVAESRLGRLRTNFGRR